MCHLCEAKKAASETYAKVHAFIKPKFESDENIESWHITGILYFLPETKPVYYVEVYMDTKNGHMHTRCFIQEDLDDHSFSLVSTVNITKELSNPIPSHVHGIARYPDN